MSSSVRLSTVRCSLVLVSRTVLYWTEYLLYFLVLFCDVLQSKNECCTVALLHSWTLYQISTQHRYHTHVPRFVPSYGQYEITYLVPDLLVQYEPAYQIVSTTNNTRCRTYLQDDTPNRRMMRTSGFYLSYLVFYLSFSHFSLLSFFFSISRSTCASSVIANYRFLVLLLSMATWCV